MQPEGSRVGDQEYQIALPHGLDNRTGCAGWGVQDDQVRFGNCLFDLPNGRWAHRLADVQDTVDKPNRLASTDSKLPNSPLDFPDGMIWACDCATATGVAKVGENQGRVADANDGAVLANLFAQSAIRAPSPIDFRGHSHQGTLARNGRVEKQVTVRFLDITVDIRDRCAGLRSDNGQIGRDRCFSCPSFPAGDRNLHRRFPNMPGHKKSGAAKPSGTWFLYDRPNGS